MFGKKKPNKDGSEKTSPLKALQPDIGPGEDDIISPLKGKSIPTALTIIGIAIAIPGGLYVLVALIIAPLLIRGFLKSAERRRDKGNTQEALEAANLAVGLKRKSATARAERALCYVELGEIKKAEEDIRFALERRPELPLALYVRGRIAEARGEDPTDDYEYYLGKGGIREDEVRQRLAAHTK